jgi:bis(5'-nucleosyl)-tetraphosphatase (symmetrical)
MGVQRVFLGDVQGCADELDALLERARATFGPEHEVWLVGDLVNRGPASLRVLQRVRELMEAGRARCVLGNHELSLISVAWGLRERRPTDTFGDVLDAPDAEDWIDWVRRLPVALTGRIGAQPIAMLHAAAHPDWTLEDLRRIGARIEARLGADRKTARAFLASDPASDPDREALALLTSCRSIAPDGRWSTEPPAAEYEAWHRPWSERAHAYGIVYGHWSLQGLHVAPGLRGIDTGCVHEGRGRAGFLTAWIPDPSKRRPFDLPDDGFWQQRALARYYRETGAS